MSRLKSQWLDEHQNWQRQDLSQKRYVYWWADGIYAQVRMDDRLCLWEELLASLKQRGLTHSPKLSAGHGALGFWNALSKVYPDSRHQRFER